MSVNGLLNQEITLASKASYNAYGRETVGTGETIRARFQKKTTQRLLPNGSLITIEATVYVPPDTAVAVDDKITYGSVDYKVYGIYTSVDGNGRTNHYRLELVKWKAT